MIVPEAAATTVAYSAGGEPSRSGTTIVAARNHHVLKIDGYSRTLSTDGSRPCFSSRPFRAGGRTWRISYRPMGSSHHPDNTDSVAFFLVLDDDNADEAVPAQASFSLLDQDGMPVPDYTLTTRKHIFSTGSSAFGYERFIRRGDLERSEHLKDDRFAVRVQVYVTKEAPSVAVVPPSDMRLHIGDLLASKEDADVEFQVGGETFEAHRLVLAARSPVFMAELLGPMKEGVAAASAVRVEDMEPRVFEALLAFMYTDTWPAEMEDEDACVMAQHLLVAADRYLLESLKSMCEDKLRERIDAGSAATILALAEQHCCPGLKKACFEFLGSPPNNLLAVIENRYHCEHLARSCPDIMEELRLISVDLSRDLEKLKVV